MLRITTDGHEASRGLSATSEIFVFRAIVSYQDVSFLRPSKSKYFFGHHHRRRRGASTIIVSSYTVRSYTIRFSYGVSGKVSVCLRGRSAQLSRNPLANIAPCILAMIHYVEHCLLIVNLSFNVLYSSLSIFCTACACQLLLKTMMMMMMMMSNILPTVMVTVTRTFLMRRLQ